MDDRTYRIRCEILDLFLDAQALIFERIRARYSIPALPICARGTCIVCGSEFEAGPHAIGLKIYCSSRCSMRQRNLRRRPQVERSTARCPCCSAEFETDGIKLFCSKRCGRRVRKRRMKERRLDGDTVSPAIVPGCRSSGD